MSQRNTDGWSALLDLLQTKRIRIIITEQEGKMRNMLLFRKGASSQDTMDTGCFQSIITAAFHDSLSSPPPPPQKNRPHTTHTPKKCLAQRFPSLKYIC